MLSITECLPCVHQTERAVLFAPVCTVLSSAWHKCAIERALGLPTFPSISDPGPCADLLGPRTLIDLGGMLHACCCLAWAHTAAARLMLLSPKSISSMLLNDDNNAADAKAKSKNDSNIFCLVKVTYYFVASNLLCFLVPEPPRRSIGANEWLCMHSECCECHCSPLLIGQLFAWLVDLSLHFPILSRRVQTLISPFSPVKDCLGSLNCPGHTQQPSWFV